MEVFNVLNTRLKKNIELSDKVYKSISNELTVLKDHFYHDEAFKVMKHYYPDRLPFADCLYIALMKKLEIEKIISFDKHFNNIEGIERIH